MRTFENLARSTSPQTGSQLTLFAEDSPAKTSALPGEVAGSTAPSQGFGVSIAASLRKRVRPGSSSKTPPSFALEVWTQCSGALMRSGMMRSGTVSRLTPLAHLTGGIASGLLPTPLASETGFRRSKFPQGGTSLSTALGGIPNPLFVEWLMNFPPNHTA